MDAPKHAGTRSIVSLAYDNRRTPNWKKREQAGIPGPLHDLFWIGAFLIALVGYLARPI